MKKNTAAGMIFNIQKFSINDGPGIRTVVFFKGCPLKCSWCANPESQEPQREIIWDSQKCSGCHTCLKNCPHSAITAMENGIAIDTHRCSASNSCASCKICIEKCPSRALKAEGDIKTVDEVMRIVMQDEPFYEESGGGVTLSGGEAAMQPDFALALLKALQEKHIHTAMETTGFASPAAFAKLLPYLDLLLFDIKHWDNQKHIEGTGVSHAVILKNMKTAIDQGKNVLPRLPVIPGYNDSLADAEGFVQRLQEVGAHRVQLLPFHQFGENKYHLLGKNYAFVHTPALHPEDLAAFQQVFLQHGIEAFF